MRSTSRNMAAVIQTNLPVNIRKLCAAVSTLLNQQRYYHEVTGDIICPSMVQGIDHIRDPRLNKVYFIPLSTSFLYYSLTYPSIFRV